MSGHSLPAISWLALYVMLGWCVRAFMVPVILRRQFAPGAAVAWLGIIFLHPYIGGTLYMLLGETRLGPNRVERHGKLVARYRSAVRANQSADRSVPPEITPVYEPMVRQAEKVSHLPVLGGSAVDFIDHSDTFVDRLVADIDRATDHVHLLYYMFFSDSTGRRVASAVERAAKRGVTCRVLVDAVAGRGFFHRDGLGPALALAGARVVAAQPVAPIRRRLPRMDLRNHRKLAVIDGCVAYAGSQNLVDPDYGGRRGAPWVDLSGRFTGPIVSELAAVFAEDWAFETDELLELSCCAPAVPEGGAMQVVPTGPTSLGESFRRVLLGALQCARRRAVLTTPYFVPDEPTLVGLSMAADRGVDVSLLLPQTPDHIFTAAAGRAHFSRLLRAGVRIHLFQPGLLHAKTLTIDDELAIFGSANLDVRSFNLNFELSILLYGSVVTRRLADLQAKYLQQCRPLELSKWESRPLLQRYAENAISLLSPLL